MVLGTRVQFLTSMLYGSQLPVTQGLGDMALSSSLCRYLHVYEVHPHTTHTHAHAYTYINHNKWKHSKQQRVTL